MTDRYELEQRLDKAEWVLNNSGFRRCDIAACNCGSWHQVGGFKARFDEIREAVEEADYSTNGKILLDVVKEIIADAKRTCAPAQAAPDLSAGMRKAMEIVGEMRMSEAGIFDEKHSGQRGEDRSNALYDAYTAIRLALPSTGRGTEA